MIWRWLVRFPGKTYLGVLSWVNLVSDWVAYFDFWLLCNIQCRKPNPSFTSWRPLESEPGTPVCQMILSVTNCSGLLCAWTEYPVKKFINWLCRTRQQFIGALTASIFTAWLVNFDQFGDLGVAIIENCVCHGAGRSAFPVTDCSGRKKLFTQELWFLGLFQMWGTLNTAFFFQAVSSYPQKTPQNLLVKCCWSFVATAKTQSCGGAHQHRNQQSTHRFFIFSSFVGSFTGTGSLLKCQMEREERPDCH